MGTLQALRLLKRTLIASIVLLLEAAVLGNVIRVRAQYAPKEEHPEGEDDREVMSVSFWRMLKRVIRLEGWRGLFRGIVLLVLLSLGVVTLISLIDSGNVFNTIHPILRTILGYIFLVLFGVPFFVVYVRSVTVAELLPFCDIRRSIRVLLSPSERRRPWLLFLKSGLLLTVALERAFGFILVPILIKLIHRHLPPSAGIYAVRNDPQTIAKFGLAVVYTLIITPLQVVAVRLAVQRCEEQAILLTDSDDIPNDQIAEGEGEVDASMHVGKKVSVVRLRTDTEQPAYTCLFSCMRSIVAEEGFETLYRVWWFTFLTGLAMVYGVGKLSRI